MKYAVSAIIVLAIAVFITLSGGGTLAAQGGAEPPRYDKSAWLPPELGARGDEALPRRTTAAHASPRGISVGAGHERTGLQQQGTLSDWILMWQAERTASGGVMLTPAERYRIGYLYHPQPYQISSKQFSVTFSFEIGGGSGADGLALVLAPSLPPEAEPTIGTNSDCGGCHGSRHFEGGIAVAFDTYRNSWDSSDNHVEINLLGEASPRTLAAADLPQSLSDGGVYDAKVVFDGGRAAVYLSNPGQEMRETLVLSHIISDFVPFEAYIGFVATTGAATDRHIIHNAFVQAAAPVAETDRLALLALWNATDGPNWTTKWDTSKPPAEWNGVTVENGRVVALELRNIGLAGTIPPELGSLAGLEYLELGDRQLSGSIPPELGNLANLEWLQLEGQLSGAIPPELGNLANLNVLSLSGNQLSGAIPPELGKLANLTGLGLEVNQLSGAIPAELSNLTNLTHLYLHANQLTGAIPPELSQLSNLEYLLLGDSPLSGAIPPELGNLTNLTNLGIDSTQLSGTIPPELGNLTNLEGLWLRDNKLTGAIPPELGRLSNLEFLNLEDNQLSGTIPVELGSLANLTWLYLAGNQLTGCVPGALQYVPNNDFDRLGLDFCGHDLTLAPQLYWVDEEAQKIQRIVGEGDAKSVADLAISEQLLDTPGSIALDPVRQDKVYWTDGGAIRRANLDGSGVETLKAGLADPVGIALADGHLYWADRRQRAIYRSEENIHPHGVQITADDLVYGVDQPYQIVLDTANGHIYWTERGGSKIRRANLDGLSKLNCSNNLDCNINFTDYAPENPFGLTIDPVLGKMYWTERRDGGDVIARADLDGRNGEIVVNTEPYSLSGIVVDVNDGAIYWTDEKAGAIRRAEPTRAVQTLVTGLSAPEGIAIAGPILGPTRLALTALYRSTDGPNWRDNTNWLSDGPLSEWHGVSTVEELDVQVVGLSLGDNRLVGQLPALLGTLNDLERLDLSYNHLNGSIPMELGDLVNLRRLDLSGNQLTGVIPNRLSNFDGLAGCEKIGTVALTPGVLEILREYSGELANLEIMDLSDNGFSGTIPPLLCSLANLQRLDLGHNRLSGTIPQELGKLGNLRELDLADQSPFNKYLFSGQADEKRLANCQDDCYLHGQIPQELGDLTNLEVLNISNNRLREEIPADLGDLANLEVLDLSHNRLSGEIPPRLSNTNGAACLGLPPQEFQPGGAANNLGRLTRLWNLDLSSNALDEEIPVGLCTLSTLKFLDLSRNMLTEAIPASLGHLRYLEAINLQGNRLTGQIPEGWMDLRLAFLDLYDNQFSPNECVPIRPEILERQNVVLGTRGLPSERCLTPEEHLEILEMERYVLNALYENTQPNANGAKLRELFKANFRVENVPKAPSPQDKTVDEMTDAEILRLWEDTLDILIVGGSDAAYNWDLASVATRPYPRSRYLKFKGDNPNLGTKPIEPILEQFRDHAGWKNRLGWGTTEALDTWYGVTTDDEGHIIGVDLNGNNLIGSIPVGFEHGLPYLQWLGLGGNKIRGGCIPPELLRPLLIGDLVWLSVDWHLYHEMVKLDPEIEILGPSASLDLQPMELASLSTEDLYKHLEIGLADGREAGESMWDTYYRHVLLPNAVNASEETGRLDRSTIEGVRDGLEDFGRRIVKKAPKSSLKLLDIKELEKELKIAGKLIGPMKTVLTGANRLTQYAGIKLRTALCPPPAPDAGLTRSGQQSYETDKDALIALFEATGGKRYSATKNIDDHSWKTKTNWLSDRPIGTWYGVHTERLGTDKECADDSDDCRVVAIDLSVSDVELNVSSTYFLISPASAFGEAFVEAQLGNGLTGQLPPQLGSLGELKYLNLSKNQLTGPIPPELGNLKNLQELALNHNQLANETDANGVPLEPPIPPELGNLSSLAGLYLQNNQLRGDIPLELSRLSLLRLHRMDFDKDDSGEYGLRGCLPPNPIWLTTEEQIRLVNAAYLTYVTWGPGAPIGATGKAIKQFAKDLGLGGKFSMGVRVANGAGRIGGEHAKTLVQNALPKVYKAYLVSEKAPKIAKVGGALVATVMAEYALGAFAEPIEKAGTFSIIPVEYIGGHIAQLNDRGSYTTRKDIVMDKAWCKG